MKALLLSTSLLLAGSLALATLNPLEAGAPAAAQPTPVVGTFNVDAGHSGVLFKIKHMGASNFYGRFNQISGAVNFDEANPANSSVTITIPTSSVDTNSKKRDEHLLSPDFLDAKQFPKLEFKSDSVKRTGDTWQATGTLSFHGTRKPISIDFEKTGEGKSRDGKRLLGFESVFTIDRTDWGINYGVGALGKEIEVTVALEVIGE